MARLRPSSRRLLSDNTTEHNVGRARPGSSGRTSKRLILGIGAKLNPKHIADHITKIKASRALPGLGAVKISLEVLTKLASALPGPVQAVAETGLVIVKYAEVRLKTKR